MQRTINHTGRRKIEAQEVQIHLHEKQGGRLTFDVDFSLDARSLPSTAAIYIEAYRNNTLQRFFFGSVGHIEKPEDLSLDQLDLSGPVLFRVRIVDESERVGRLIASADRLKASGDIDEDSRTSLFTVRKRPLGEVTWKIEFETGGKPELCINDKIPAAIEQLRNNVIFQSLIFPAALREVLLYICQTNLEEDEIYQEWIRFAEYLAPGRPVDDTSDLIDKLSWIDEVVEGFCKQFELCSTLSHRMEEGDD